MNDCERAKALAGAECTLDDCPPGLFFFRSNVFFKSEYATETKSRKRQVDAYCIDSGEYFWGGASSAEERAALIVRPVSISDLLTPRTLRPEPPQDLREVVARAMFEKRAELIASPLQRIWPGLADAALSAILEHHAIVPREPSEPSEAMVEAALDKWFADPKWREVFDGHPCRDSMRRSIRAALVEYAEKGNG